MDVSSEMQPSNQQAIIIPKKAPMRVHLGFFYRSATGIPILSNNNRIQTLRHIFSRKGAIQGGDRPNERPRREPLGGDAEARSPGKF